MKRFLSALLLLAAAALPAQTKFQLFTRVEATPGAAVGDTYYTSNTSGLILRLAIGSSGQAHLVSGGIPAWGTLGFAGGGTGATSFTAGSIPFSTGSVFSQDNSHLFWDATNKRLGIGVAMAADPTASLNVRFNGSGFTPGPVALFENTVGDSELWVKGPSTQNTQVTLTSGRDWVMLNQRSGKNPPNGFTICDGTAEPPCETTGLRFSIDSSGNIFTQVGSLNFGVAPGTATSTTAGHAGFGGLVAIAGEDVQMHDFCLNGATSGSACYGLAATGGDGTRYNLPITAPSGGSTFLSCGVPSSSISTCTFTVPSGAIGGTTSATFIPYSSGANTLSDSTLSWNNTSKLLTSGIGGITFKGSSSGGPTLVSPATGGAVTFTLPSADGSAGYLLKTDGSANLSFVNPAIAGGGNFTSTGALGSEPASPTAGDLYFPNNGYAIERNTNGASSGWGPSFGPVFPFTLPPTLVSTKTTTLSANINNAVTSLTFTVGTGWPAVPFLMQIGTEVFTVTALNTGTGVATVTRGYNSTSAASHTAGDTITQLNWIWINQGATATATQHQQGFTINGGTSSATQNPRILARLIGSNTAFVIGFLPTLNTASGNCTVGLIFRESGTGKIARYKIAYTSGNVISGTVGNDPNLTTFGANTTSSIFVSQPIAWIKGALVSTNMVYSYSSDLQNWVDHTTIAKTSQFTTAPDQWGVYDDPQTASANKCFINLLHVTETP